MTNSLRIIVLKQLLISITCLSYKVLNQHWYHTAVDTSISVSLQHCLLTIITLIQLC